MTQTISASRGQASDDKSLNNLSLVPDKNMHHKIWGIAAPMMLANISVPLLGLVDTAILGHLDQARYLSAVAIGTSLLSLVFWGLAFLRAGTTGSSAQCLGRGGDSAAVLAQAGFLALLLAATLLLIAPPFIAPAVSAMNAPASAQALAEEYVLLRLWGSPAQLLSFAIGGWLIGQQRARWPLAMVLVANGSNILLDWLFIIEWDMNSRGAALATVLAEYLGLTVGLWAVRQTIATLLQRHWRQILGAWTDYRGLITANSHLFLRTLCLLGSFMFFTAQGAAQGETVLAANTILFQLMLLAAYGLDGFAQASEALAGEAIGSKNQTRFYAVCWACSQWSFFSAIIFTLGFWLGEASLLNLMTSIAAVQDAAATQYHYLLLLPLVAFLSYQLDGIFIGALQTRWMLYTMLFSVFAVYLPLWWWLQDMGNTGLWIALLSFNAARSISLALVFTALSRRQLWIRATVAEAG